MGAGRDVPPGSCSLLQVWGTHPELLAETPWAWLKCWGSCLPHRALGCRRCQMCVVVMALYWLSPIASHVCQRPCSAWAAQVTDFNLSRITETGPAVQSSLTANNPRWLAPEVRRGLQWSCRGLLIVKQSTPA